MKPLSDNIASVLRASFIVGLLSQGNLASAEPPDSSPVAPPAEPPASAPDSAAPKAAPSNGSSPFSLGRGVASQRGRSPYSSATNLDHPPSVYIVPMEGEMGLDISKEVYEKVLVDLKAAKPDIVIFRMRSSDGTLKSGWLDGKREEDRKKGRLSPGQLASGLQDYADLAGDLHRRLDGIPCVMYVEDAVGASSMLALAWPCMFVAPQGRIGGLEIMGAIQGAGDEQVHAKFEAAKVSMVLGILELGGRPAALGESLVLPDRKLSVQFEGRTPTWRPDAEGQWIIVDSSDKLTAQFDASLAEDTGLADGIAEGIDDLVALLGYPQWQKVGNGEKIFQDYNAAWRAKWSESMEMMAKFQEEAGPEDLAARKQILEKMLQYFKRYPSLAKFWKMRGLDEKRIKLLLEELDGQMRSIRQERQQGSGSSGGSGKMGGGRGPGAPR